MLKHASAWMRSTLATILLFSATGCVSAVSDRAICDGTSADRTAHAAALARDSGDLSVTTGAALIRKLDAACKD